MKRDPATRVPSSGSRRSARGGRLVQIAESLAAEALIVELELAFERITDAPEMHPRHIHSTRQYLLRRFSFRVVYRHSSMPDGEIVLFRVRRHALDVLGELDGAFVLDA